MVKYLQLDGVDDTLKAPSVTFDEIIMEFKARYTPTTEYYLDARTGVANAYLYRNTSNVDFTSGSAPWANNMYWNGVKFSNSTATIPYDSKGTLRLVLSASGTDDVNFFANNANTASTLMAADVFSIKLLLGGVVKAFYDMSTGTVLDQSGNGNHATLTGGTWLDDGTGGTPTGTDGSTAFDLRPILYSDSFATSDTKQILYGDSFVQMDAKQAIYNDSASAYDTRFNLYQDSAVLFDTLQEFFSDGIVGSIPFDIRMVLYADNSAVFDSKQALYSDGSATSDLAQQFYQAGGSTADMKLVIYADASPKFDASQTLYSDAFLKADTAQRYFTEGTIDFDTLQAILEDWNEYHEVIRIVLNITQSKSATLGFTQRQQAELKM